MKIKGGFVFILMLCIFFTGGAICGLAETRRALLIGIDSYQKSALPEKGSPNQEKITSSEPERMCRNTWSNLDGAVNDAKSMKDMLVTKYGFKEKDIVLLTEQNATRDGILNALRDHLLKPATAQDISFFYYAGHGSQVLNSKSKEEDKKDESIVPYDSNKGAMDIRDKELAKIFNEIEAKKIQLVAVFDSCHSGSIGRGIPSAAAVRKVSTCNIDVEDPSVIPSPEEKGALIISSSQDFQLASEIEDEEGELHGAFTVALLKALGTSDANAPVEEIAARTRAILKNNGFTQEPVFAGINQWNQKALFGQQSVSSNKPRVAVIKIDDNANVILQGGYALGLGENSELVKVKNEKDSAPVQIKIISVNSLTSSTAKVTSGEITNIKEGDLFELALWAPPDQENLKVCLQDTSLSVEKIMQISEEISKISSDERIQWIDDPTDEESPSHIMYWEGSSWKLIIPGKNTENLGNNPTSSMVLDKLAAKSTEKVKFFLKLPVPLQLASELLSKTEKNKLSVTFKKICTGTEHYEVTGRFKKQQIQYALVIPGATKKDKTVLPLITDWINLLNTGEESKNTIAETLLQKALCIGKIRAWLTIQPPDTDDGFPYSLALKNAKTKLIRTEGTLKEGEDYGLVLLLDKKKLERRTPEKRYVYVFTIDSYGSSSLLFPGMSAGNAENHLPISLTEDEKWPEEIQLGSSSLFRIGPPFGGDTFLLLSSAEPIQNAELIFTHNGVRTRSVTRGNTNPFEQLLSNIGSSTRGANAIAPLSWSISRISVRSVP